MYFSNLSKMAELVRADLNLSLFSAFSTISQEPVLLCLLIAQFYGSLQPFSTLTPSEESLSNRTKTTILEYR